MTIPLNPVTLRRVAAIAISAFGALNAAGTFTLLPKTWGAVLGSLYPTMLLLEHTFGITATPSTPPSPVPSLSKINNP